MAHIPKIFPVIHYHDADSTMRQAEIAFHAGCAGIFLIHMFGQDHFLDSPAVTIKARWPERFVGTNRLSMSSAAAIVLDAALGLDGTWSDRPDVHSDPTLVGDVASIADVLNDIHRTRPDFSFFSSVAFKYQAPEPDPASAARIATSLGWIPTTSGIATGVAADIAKLKAMRETLPEEAPLAIASGVTPENVRAHARYVTHILVATGISLPDRDVFDPTRLARLVAALQE